MNTRDLLIEIGTEELPPKALKTLSRAFLAGIHNGLKSAGLEFEDLVNYASPRRLSVLVIELQEKQEDKPVERRGPALAAAFDDDGCPTQAAKGFAKSCGVEVEELDKLETEKGSWLTYSNLQKGESVQTLITDIINKSLDALPIPKRMRWSDLKDQFVRPVHWVVLLFGDEVIDTKILGVKTGRETRGHRFHHPETLYIGEPVAYAPLLETEGHVIVEFEARREAIRAQILEIANTVKGTAVIDDALLDEVTSMVEWPQAVLGNFDERFLDVPGEALISAMKGHQKYFHLLDPDEKLMPHFITISNIESKEPDKVREGNERVIRPRLSDSEFFWKQDQKRSLQDRVTDLKTVVFQTKLGTLYDKVQRTMIIASSVATQLGYNEDDAKRAAELCKSDLLTDMVNEFPDLQGVMGRYYAKLNGENDQVVTAIEEHYMPRFSGDTLPQTNAGICVALADKIDTLVGIFTIGLVPSGDKDPFALRRAALGICRILLEQNMDLTQLIKLAIKNYTYQKIPVDITKTTNLVYQFIIGRLQVLYSGLDFKHDEIDAVLCLKPNLLQDSDRKLRALASFRTLPEAESLSAANKRISNILKKVESEIPDKWNTFLFAEKEEKDLADAITRIEPKLEPLFQNQDYSSALKKLADLRESVDAFFSEVMVMDKDEALRNNRLALLSHLRNLFLRVADLSKLQ